MARVVVFGLDAASPTLVQRWAANLPNLRRLMEEGTWGVLHSTVPPFTFPAWPCMATGKNPGRVGIFGLRYRQEGTYRFSTPNSSHWQAPAIWDLVSRAGRQAIVFNVPGTYPPTRINGVMVSGKPAPTDPKAVITYPSDLRKELDQVTGGYQSGPSADFDDASRGNEFETWTRVLESQQKALEYLMETVSWNLLFAVSMAIDGVSHHFWKYLDPDHPEYEPEEARRFGEVIHTIYRLEDSRLGRVVERLSEEDLLLVVSDHGSAPCYRHIAVNRWLIDNGYLRLYRKFSSSDIGLAGSLAQIIFSLYRRYAWVRRLAAPLRRTTLRDAVVEVHFRHTRGRAPLESLPIDWSNTTAYYLGDNCLYLNVCGREPQGIVQPGADYERRRTELQVALQAMQDPITGRPLFAAVYTREELYEGPYLEQAPDLVLVPADPRWSLGGAVGEVVVDRPVVSGTHHPEGLFIAWGCGVRKGHKSEASVLDVAPTALHALGLPVPEDTDGSVRLDWFTPESPAATRPVKTERTMSAAEREHYEWSPEEEAEIEAHLRDLGYLD